MKRALHQKEFLRRVDAYQPNEFEVMGQGSWAEFKRPMNYLLRNRHRFYKVLEFVFNHYHLHDAAFLDLGPYPGTFLKLLRQMNSSKGLELFGAGLLASERFVKLMKEEAGARILEVNLDPKNPDLAGRRFNSEIPLEEESIDYIHAGEIIEHFVNPAWMLEESLRVLKPGGGMIITTPNVSRIGNVFKLLTGSSNYARLQPIGEQDPSDEWRAHFHEYAMAELADLLSNRGFRVLHSRYYNCRDREMVVKNWKQMLIGLLKIPFYNIPHLREDIFMAVKKP
jgi:SAM-dependent methyltransferase